jgi:hypothetical protein
MIRTPTYKKSTSVLHLHMQHASRTEFVMQKIFAHIIWKVEPVLINTSIERRVHISSTPLTPSHAIRRHLSARVKNKAASYKYIDRRIGCRIHGPFAPWAVGGGWGCFCPANPLLCASLYARRLGSKIYPNIFVLVLNTHSNARSWCFDCVSRLCGAEDLSKPLSNLFHYG